MIKITKYSGKTFTNVAITIGSFKLFFTTILMPIHIDYESGVYFRLDLPYLSIIKKGSKYVQYK